MNDYSAALQRKREDLLSAGVLMLDPSAVYVEEACRCRGIAGELLKAVCDDMAAKGISTLYLLTDHTSFYERYGWEFLGMVQGDGEPEMSRMYVHRQ